MRMLVRQGRSHITQWCRQIITELAQLVQHDNNLPQPCRHTLNALPVRTYARLSSRGEHALSNSAHRTLGTLPAHTCTCLSGRGNHTLSNGTANTLQNLPSGCSTTTTHMPHITVRSMQCWSTLTRTCPTGEITHYLIVQQSQHRGGGIGLYARSAGRITLWHTHDVATGPLFELTLGKNNAGRTARC